MNDINDLNDLNEKYYISIISYLPKRGDNMFKKPEFYGKTTVGERGQIVLPVELRKKFGINVGDKLLILGDKHMDFWNVNIVKAEVLSKMMGMINQDIRQILEKNEDE